MLVKSKAQDQVFSVATDLPPAPELLLLLIRYNCSSDCSSNDEVHLLKECWMVYSVPRPATGDTNFSNTVDYESEDSED